MASRNDRQPSVPETVSELWQLTKDYARQETVDPLKGVGRYVAYGTAAAFLGGLGIVFLLLALLRALQTETGSTFTGNWSWAPYLIVLAVGGAVAAVAVLRISRRKGNDL